MIAVMKNLKTEIKPDPEENLNNLLNEITADKDCCSNGICKVEIETDNDTFEHNSVERSEECCKEICKIEPEDDEDFSLEQSAPLLRYGGKGTKLSAKRRLWLCEICQNLFTKRQYEKHIGETYANNIKRGSVKSEKFTCRVCHAPFTCVTDYRKHFKWYHVKHSEDDMFIHGWKCSICSTVVESEKRFRYHWNQKHRKLYNVNKIDKKRSYSIIDNSYCARKSSDLIIVKENSKSKNVKPNFSQTFKTMMFRHLKTTA